MPDQLKRVCYLSQLPAQHVVVPCSATLDSVRSTPAYVLVLNLINPVELCLTCATPTFIYLRPNCLKWSRRTVTQTLGLEVLGRQAFVHSNTLLLSSRCMLHKHNAK